MGKKGDHSFLFAMMLVLLFVIAGATSEVRAQVAFHEDAQTRLAIDAYKQKYRSRETIKAWRIQFLYTNDRRESEEKREKIKREFPQFEIKWIHKKPYYLIRGGAFETELEARRFLEEIKEEYPEALTVTEDIEPQEILESLQK